MAYIVLSGNPRNQLFYKRRQLFRKWWLRMIWYDYKVVLKQAWPLPRATQLDPTGFHWFVAPYLGWSPTNVPLVFIVTYLFPPSMFKEAHCFILQILEPIFSLGGARLFQKFCIRSKKHHRLKNSWFQTRSQHRYDYEVLLKQEWVLSWTRKRDPIGFYWAAPTWIELPLASPLRTMWLISSSQVRLYKLLPSPF